MKAWSEQILGNRLMVYSNPTGRGNEAPMIQGPCPADDSEAHGPQGPSHDAASMDLTRTNLPPRQGLHRSAFWLLALCLGAMLQAAEIPAGGQHGETGSETAKNEEPLAMEREGPGLQTSVNAPEAAPGGDNPGMQQDANETTPLQPALPKPNPEPASVEWLGQTWVLCRHQGRAGADTDEYFVQGEGPADWSQVLAVQRIPSGTPAGLAARLGTQAGVHCQVLREDEASCVLALTETGEDPKDGVLLVQKAGPAGGALIVISYLQRTTRLEATRAALQLGAWRERLLAQAHRNPPRKAEKAPTRP